MSLKLISSYGATAVLFLIETRNLVQQKAGALQSQLTRLFLLKTNLYWFYLTARDTRTYFFEPNLVVVYLV